MLKRLFRHFTEKRRRVRRDLATRLFAILDRNGSLVLDTETAATLGSTHKETFLLVCYLSICERLHLLSEDDDRRVVVISNREFVNRIRPVTVAEAAAVSEPSGVETQEPLAIEETMMTDSAWYSIETALKEALGEDGDGNLPLRRQSLPDRRREPWNTQKETPSEIN